MALRCVVFSGDVGFVERVRTHAPRDVRVVLADPRTDGLSLPREGGALVVLGPDHDPDVALELAGLIAGDHPDVGIVLTAEPTPGMLRTALRAGAAAVVDAAAPEEELRATLARVAGRVERRQALDTIPAEQPRPDRGKVIVVLSPKGGAGKTFIATNLAVALAHAHPHDVVIVDADVQFGDVAATLNLRTAATTLTGGTVSRRDLLSQLRLHPSGAYALCAPQELLAEDDIDVEWLAAVLRILADEFRYVVVDTPAGLPEPTLTALEAATDVVAVTTTDTPAARDLHRGLRILAEAHLVPPRCHLVVNRTRSRVGLEANDLAVFLGLPVAAAVPSSLSVPVSINRGVPLVEAEPDAAGARALLALAARLAEPDPVEVALTA